MDSFIAQFPAVRDDDLMIAEGVAWQADMTARVRYDADYFAKVSAYEDGAIAKAVNEGRCAMLRRHLSRGAAVLDIGAGSGAFIRAAGMAGFDAKGFDVMPESVFRLKRHGVYADDPAGFDAVTMWDSIEHMQEPAAWFGRMRSGACLFASIPVFDDFTRIRESKHYRPGEHLYYWTPAGFTYWLALYGFSCIEVSTHETDAGRENIGAFAFRRYVTVQ